MDITHFFNFLVRDVYTFSMKMMRKRYIRNFQHCPGTVFNRNVL